MPASRRDLLVGGLVVAGLYAGLRHGPSLARRLTGPDFAFEPLDRPAGFRRLSAGSSSIGGFDPFVGLDAGPRAAAPEVPVAAVEARLCDALFPGRDPAGGAVPVASFSDYRCPYCRTMSVRLAALETDGVATVAWHELPLLGDGSRIAAAAALAARAQGAYGAVHDRLMRSPFEPTEASLRAVADAAGIDADRLLADMDDPAVDRALATSEALARLLGIVGTPVAVVGRTVVHGLVDPDALARLVAVERAAGPVPGCA